MAGIEKVCEWSDDYPGHEMYRFKRNHIQIMPEYRHLFRGVQAELVFTGVEVNVCGRLRDGGVYTIWEGVSDLAYPYNCDHHAWWKDKELYDGQFLRLEYQYELRVTDPALQGYVEGVYKNWSTDKSTVVRRIKRMVGSGLVINNECRLGRAQIIKAWKASKVAEARALIKHKNDQMTAQLADGGDL